MKKIILTACFILLIANYLKAQFNPGDTIITSTFNYSQTQFSRDSFIHFPDYPNITYEKIYMMYNLRCKDGLISPPVQGQTNIGCGEWDYTCNTYVVDSTRSDSSLTTHPSHIITNFVGQTYHYTNQPTYTYKKYKRFCATLVPPCQVIVFSPAIVGAGANTTPYPFNTSNRTTKSIFLWKKSEMLAAGIPAQPNFIRAISTYLSVGGTTGLYFVKIRMKHTTLDSLDNSNLDLTGFTEVFSCDKQLQGGQDDYIFYNPFHWNATDNILIEFSFTNPTTGTPNLFESDNTPFTSGLVTTEDDYAYEFLGNSFIQLGNPNFNNFSNEITLSFWSKGNEQLLPQNTTLIHAVNAQNQRKINLHFPWSDSRFYWDCGSIGASYDRIDKAATNAEVKGVWNHWAFTKNATTGVMNVYKNGTLWHTGSGKTKLFNDITNVIVGNIQGLTYPYYGMIDELSIWNKELSQATIQNWMNKPITPAHPNYANLDSYYSFNEGNGSTCTDGSPNNIVSNINGTPLWRIIKGHELFKNFTTTANRPKIQFHMGICDDIDTSNMTYYYDTILNAPNIVYSFAIQNGVVVPVDTIEYYQAGYSYIYDGNTNTIIDSILNPTVGTINITDLLYYVKSPSAYQLVSFVTPYGINLDLGMSGKTWIFDVTDYAPILQGWKRMFVNGGGERQEDMDIKFMYIVGTPPRNVIDVRNIWGVKNAGSNSLLNNTSFEPRDVLMNPNAVSYKIRTAITGHGQEGEFIPQNHFINLNGGPKEFQWNVWKECASNPVYPQGGTWIYDRAGWCPGMSTNVKEMDITPYTTPGVVANIDYGIDTAWGSSNYWVSNTLMSYGPPNFALDAAVVDIKNPSQKIEFARTNPICNNPLITIRNNGSTPLTSLKINYWVNNNPLKESYLWQGNLNFMETEDVSVPFSDNLWSAVNGPNNNIFHAEISAPNNGMDAYSFNNVFNSTFDISNVLPSNFVIWFKTNAAALESKYEIRDQNGQQVFLRNNMTNNTNYKDTLHLGWGCYSLIISDSDDDGIDFWANNDGIGFARLRTLNNGVIKNFEGDFGRSLIYNFTVDYPLSYEQLYKEVSVSVYPNPMNDYFTVACENMEMKEMILYNQTGQKMPISYKIQGNNQFRVDVKSLSKGIYFLKVIGDKEQAVKKIVIE